MLEFERDETPFPHKEITEGIIGSAFEVYNHWVTVFSIACISDRFKLSWRSAALAETWRRERPVRYKEVIVGEYDGDMIVNDVVLVEIKIAPQYDKRDEAQLLNVLKATGLKLGILLNFGRYKVEFKRFIL
jgi:GxxExxY protein